MLRTFPWDLMYCNGEEDPLIPGDVLFRVTDSRNPEESKLYEGHKLLLGAVSPILKEQIFAASNEEGLPEVPVNDTTPAAFETVLKYIYLGEEECNLSSSVLVSDEATLRHVFDVLVLADNYGINDLRDFSQSILMEKTLITEENLFTVARLGDGHPFEDLKGSLKNSCKKFLSNNVQLHGTDFIQKIISQEKYDNEVFEELMKMKDTKNNKHSTTSIDSGNVSLNTSDSDSNSSPIPEKKCRIM